VLDLRELPGEELEASGGMERVGTRVDRVYLPAWRCRSPSCSHNEAEGDDGSGAATVVLV